MQTSSDGLCLKEALFNSPAPCPHPNVSAHNMHTQLCWMSFGRDLHFRVSRCWEGSCYLYCECLTLCWPGPPLSQTWKSSWCSTCHSNPPISSGQHLFRGSVFSLQEGVMSFVDIQWFSESILVTVTLYTSYFSQWFITGNWVFGWLDSENYTTLHACYTWHYLCLVLLCVHVYRRVHKA